MSNAERPITRPAPAPAGRAAPAPAPAARAIEPAPQPAPPSTTFEQRVAATGSGAASEDATEGSRRHARRDDPAGHVRADDPHNGPAGRAQAAGGTDAIARMANKPGEPLDL